MMPLTSSHHIIDKQTCDILFIIDKQTIVGMFCYRNGIITKHINASIYVSESIRWYWQYHSVRPMENCIIYRKCEKSWLIF